MKAAAFDFASPTTCEEAIALLGVGMAKPVGGTQSLGPMMNLRLAQPETLVALSGIDELRVCRSDEDHVVIGACVTHAEIEDGRIDDPSRGFLIFVAQGIAYRAVRNRGTLGGSLAHADPAADWINAMPLLGAELIVVGPAGRRSVPASDWMLGAFTTSLSEDELLAGVRIARLSEDARWSYYKFNRKTGEFAEAIAAFVVDPTLGICRGLIGALDGAPHVIADAQALLVNPADTASYLAAAGLTPDTYEYRTHDVALQRAAAQLKEFPPR
jgi:carbon-monoxide dehydrogenase medium subunit